MVIDPLRLRYELSRRGLTATQLAALSGVGEVTISRARAGQPVTVPTFRALADTLAAQPVLPSAELLLSAPERETTATELEPSRSKEARADRALQQA